MRKNKVIRFNEKQFSDRLDEIMESSGVYVTDKPDVVYTKVRAFLEDSQAEDVFCRGGDGKISEQDAVVTELVPELAARCGISFSETVLSLSGNAELPSMYAVCAAKKEKVIELANTMF